MKFTSTVSFLTLAAIASAAKNFGIVTIHSGSMFQYADLYENNDQSNIYVGAGDSTGSFTLNDDGSLTFQDKKLAIDSNGDVKFAGDKLEASKKFGLKGEHLTIDGKESFIACPADNNKYVLSIKCNKDAATGVALRAMDIKDVASKTSSSASAKPTTLTTSTKKSDSTATASSEVKEGCSFGVISIRSGSDFQNTAIKKVDSHTHVFSVGGSEGEELTLTVQKDGSLKDQDGRSIYVDPSTGEVGNVDPFGKESASKPFSIKDGYLAFNDNSGFYACPSNNGYTLSTKTCTGGSGIGLAPVNQKC